MAIYELDGTGPRNFPAMAANWIAETAVVIGRLVRVKQDASIWWGSVLRGRQRVDRGVRAGGAHQHPGKLQRLHTDMGYPMTIGARLHHRPTTSCCTVARSRRGKPDPAWGRSFLNVAKIRPRASLVGAGALVTEGKEFPRELPDRRLAPRRRDPHLRRKGREGGCPFAGRVVREALEPVREGDCARIGLTKPHATPREFPQAVRPPNRRAKTAACRLHPSARRITTIPAMLSPVDDAAAQRIVRIGAREVEPSQRPFAAFGVDKCDKRCPRGGLQTALVPPLHQRPAPLTTNPVPHWRTRPVAADVGHNLVQACRC